jgi:hypothetical protein
VFYHKVEDVKDKKNRIPGNASVVKDYKSKKQFQKEKRSDAPEGNKLLNH